MTAQRQIETKLVHEPLNAGNTVLDQDFGKFGLLCSSLENIGSEQLSRVLDDFLSQGFVFAPFGKFPPQKTTRVKQNHATAVSKVVLASDMQAGNTDVAQRFIVRQRAHVCVEMKSRKSGTRGLEGQLHVTEMLAENNTANDRPTVRRTHQPVVLTLEGVKRGRLVQRLKRATRLPRIAPVGSSRRTPSNDVLLGMTKACEHRTHSDAVVRATLDEAALQWGRTVETEVLGRDDLVDEKKYTGRVAVPITRQQQLLVRRGQDRLRAAKPHSGIFWCFVSEAFAACLRGHPWSGVAASSATYVARSAACGGISLTTRPRCGAGGRVGARGWHCGRMQGCR